MRPLVFTDLGAAKCSGMERMLKVIIEVQLAETSALMQSAVRSHMPTSTLVSGVGAHAPENTCFQLANAGHPPYVSSMGRWL